MKNALMCKPLFFQVKYQINPWMKIGSVNQKRAMEQWKNLIFIYKRFGIKVWVIDQQKDMPDMVFAADQGIVSGNKMLLSNFRFQERRNESKIYEKWFTDYGLNILRLPKNVYFEGGGETIRWKDIIFVGTGFRTNFQALKALQKVIKSEVIGLELLDKRFYHLDTCFFVLNEKTAFYFRPAFSKKSIELIKKHIPEVIEFEEEDVLNFAANSVVIDKSVVIQDGCDHFGKLIKQLGYTPVMTNVSEFIKAGGGIHCLTGNLDEN